MIKRSSRFNQYKFSFFIFSLMVAIWCNFILPITNITYGKFGLDSFKVHTSVNYDFINELRPYINSFDWLNTDFAEIVRNKTRSNMKKCKLCTVQNKGDTANSSPRDIVVSAAFNARYYNVYTLVRTLRSTGCLATCIYFVSDDFYDNIPSNIKEEIINCNVIILNCKKFNEISYVRAILSRFMVLKLFLSKFGYLFNRIIYHDIYDTYFQLDPFREEFDNTTLHFTTENDNIATNNLNREWVQQVDPNFSREFYLSKKIINSGLMYGGVEPMYNMLLKYANATRWKLVNRTHFLEQALLNYMYYHNEFDSNVIIDIEAVNMISATFWVFNEEPNEKGLMTLKNSNKIPTAIHQYDRICPIMTYLPKICPSVNGIETVSLSHWKYPIQKCMHHLRRAVNK